MKPVQIVLIEDNPGDVFLVSMALRESGIAHELIHFESGEDAMETLCAETPGGNPVAAAPGAILLDLNTPRTNGFETLRRIRDLPRLANVPIAILTSSRDWKDKNRAASLGAGYIEKPSQLNEFLAVIAQAVKEMLEPSATRT